MVSLHIIYHTVYKCVCPDRLTDSFIHSITDAPYGKKYFPPTKKSFDSKPGKNMGISKFRPKTPTRKIFSLKIF